MEKMGNFLVVLLLFSLITISTGQGSTATNPTHSGKFFIFGDSFVDTGNMGYPSSDGLVLSDYIASFLGVKSPVPYKWRNNGSESERLLYGINFAYSGSGVTMESFTNITMTMQIDFFKQQIDEQEYTIYDLKNSVVLVSYSGNDYLFTFIKTGNFQSVLDQTPAVVHKLAKSLKAIGKLGVKKLAIFGVPPRGCFPNYASPSNDSCNEGWNNASRFHNQLLEKEIQKLNQKNNNQYHIVFLDLYGAFLSVIDKAKGHENPLKACCVPDIGANHFACFHRGGKATICNHPELSVFWDAGHPSQNGANAICSYLKPSLNQLL